MERQTGAANGASVRQTRMTSPGCLAEPSRGCESGRPAAVRRLGQPLGVALANLRRLAQAAFPSLRNCVEPGRPCDSDAGWTVSRARPQEKRCRQHKEGTSRSGRGDWGCQWAWSSPTLHGQPRLPCQAVVRMRVGPAHSCKTHGPAIGRSARQLSKTGPGGVPEPPKMCQPGAALRQWAWMDTERN